MTDLVGLNLINSPPSNYLNEQVPNTIISNSNIVADPVLWSQLFSGFWNQWRKGYSPKFVVDRGRIVTIAINAHSKLSKLQEVENSINSILEVQSMNKKVNVKLLVKRMEIILNS
jgi:hypothetical protein